MANPPFNLDIADPTDGALGNAFPANERTFRDNVNSYLNTDHDTTTGHHKFPLLTTTQKNALTTPPSGMLVFDTTLLQLQTNTGTPSAPVWTPAFGGINGVTVTTSGSFTIPAIKVKVTGVAAGGGGGAGGASTVGGDGASGGWFICWLTGLTIGSTLTVTIGTGGTGGLAPGGGGGNGSNTILASGTQTIVTRTAYSGFGGGGGSATDGAGGNDGIQATGVAGDLLGQGEQGFSWGTSSTISSLFPIVTSAFSPYGNGGGIGGVNANGLPGINGIMFFEWVG